jgi:hypothetical protein
MNTAIHNTTRASVFLGVPAVLTARQQSYLEQWLEWLESQSLDVVRLERPAYSQYPWRTLTELISQADGVVLLGFRQLDARTATWRPHTKEEGHPAGWWTSPWLNLEAGLAVMLGLPVLVAPDEGVQEGVFSPDVWGGQVYGTAISPPGKASMEWLELVYRHRSA